ncbi:hypothetical protein ACA593_10585 [Lactiplantibacillus pentosus]
MIDFKVKPGDTVVAGQVIANLVSILARRLQPVETALKLTIKRALDQGRERLLVASNHVDPTGTVISGITTSMAGNHRVATIGPPSWD